MMRQMREGLARSLRLRVLALVACAFAAVAIPAGLAFTSIVNSTILKLGTLYAEKQVLYDRYRGLDALNREVGLAETLARAPALLSWAANETDPSEEARGIGELEHYRHAFRDRSYFFVADASGNYYFNDAAGNYTGQQYRYTLSPQNPRDGWYYATAKTGKGCQLNVDHDDNLGVTKVWINCVVADVSGKVVGIVGTGIDLTTFIQQVVNSRQEGVESLFVDRSGAIQASREADSIDFHSITKDFASKRTVFQLVDDAAGRTRLTQMFDEAAAGEGVVRAGFMRVGGREMLVGVGLLERLGWYNVMLMDVDQIIDRRLFWPIAGLLLVVMLSAAGLMTWLFKRSVLDRLSRMEVGVAQIEAGDFSNLETEKGEDEIARLSSALRGMALAVGDQRRHLEQAVRERTQQLEQLASSDSMTGVANRRGFGHDFAAASKNASGDGRALGLLLLDIDSFKAINDRFGHSAGDEIVIETARRIRGALGTGDVCGRWGGDEFVVLVHRAEGEGLEAAAGRILSCIRESPYSLGGNPRVRLTTSIGGCLIGADDTLDIAARRADHALYAAKQAGRNRFIAFETLAEAHGGAIGHVA